MKITLERIKVKELAAFARALRVGDRARGLVPISKQRARAQSLNPYADPDDVALVLANEGKRCIGYMGILPGRFQRGSRLQKIYWGSTMLIDPAYRGQNISGRFLRDGLSRHGIFSTGTSGGMEGAMASVGFIRFGAVATLAAGLPGIQLDRLPVPRTAETRHRQITEAFAWEEVSELIETDFAPIRRGAAARFYRGPEFVNWMTRERWVRERGPAPSKSSGYFFSDVYETFRYITLRVRDRATGEPKGFVVFSICRPTLEAPTWLKVLDHSFRNSRDHACILPIAWEVAVAHQATQVRFAGRLARYLPESRLANAPTHASRRPFFCCPKNGRGRMTPDPSTIRLEYCDGDTPFT